MSRELTVQRLRRRRWLLLLLTLPLAVLAIFSGVTLLTLAPTAQKGIDEYDDGYYVASQETFGSLLELNVVESWLPYFDRGDAFAAEGYYGPATDDFEQALERAPMNRKCDVRLNLALAWERFGDGYVELGYYQGAVLLYQASQAVLDAAGPECDPPEKQEQVDESTQRVEQKTQDAQKQREQQQTQGGDQQTQQDQQLQQLEQQQQDAAQEKADQQTGDRGQESGGYYVEKPW